MKSSAEVDLGTPMPRAHRRRAGSLFTAEMLVPAAGRAVEMLNPRNMVRNPVMFITELGAGLTTLVTIAAVLTASENVGYFLAVAVWLWLTVWFANFAEAVAEARGRAQAATLRKAKTDVMATRITDTTQMEGTQVPSSELK